MLSSFSCDLTKYYIWLNFCCEQVTLLLYIYEHRHGMPRVRHALLEHYRRGARELFVLQCLPRTLCARQAKGSAADAASISASSGSLHEPADLGLGLHKRGRGSGKVAGVAEQPADLPAFGKGNTCNVCSGDYYGDCDFYSVKVAPAARPPGAPLVAWHGHACCARCRGNSISVLCDLCLLRRSLLPVCSCKCL